MKKQEVLRSHEVLREVQGLVFDLAGKQLDYLEPSEDRTRKVAGDFGIEVDFDGSLVSVSNPGQGVYAMIDGSEFTAQAFRPAFKELAGKVRRGEAESEVALDIDLEPIDADVVQLSSQGMRCAFPVKRGALDQAMEDLAKEFAGLQLAEGHAALIRVSRDVRDPSGLLVEASAPELSR